MRVDIERIIEISEECKRINKLDFSEIELYENGVRVEIDPKIVEELKYLGLSNFLLLRGGSYKESFEIEE